MDAGIVATFAESPALRETLAVLLERDCQLRFLRPNAAASGECVGASLVLVALPRPDLLLRNLRQHWPALPIVAVDVTGGSDSTAAPRSDGGVCHVPLDPHAIRGTVLQQIVPDADASLRATARVIGETLRTELSYACTALRSFSALYASSVGPDTYALLGAVMREQSYVLGETVDELERFRMRPGTVALSSEFPAILCRQLQRPDPPSAERGVLCECAVDAPCRDLGPLELAPTVAGFLRVHLRRCAATAVVDVRQTPEGVSIRYRRRRSGRRTRSWPLLLAALTLEPWSWSISTSVDADQEVVRLRRAA